MWSLRSPRKYLAGITFFSLSPFNHCYSLQSFLYFLMKACKKIFTAFFLLVWIGFLPAQDHPSIHQEEWEYYRNNPESAVIHADTIPSVPLSSLYKSSALNAMVYGFHPYWMNGNEVHYQYDLLTHLAYFSADVDPATGNFSSTHNYSTANVITQAKNAGVKVHLTIVCFSNHATLWANQSSVNNLVNNIIAKVKERNIDGVNIDFESMVSSDALPFKNFILQLGDTLKKYNKELTVELFAVDWRGIFPASFFTDVDHVVDSYFIMLYAYYYSGSTTAGPNSPLRISSASGYHVLKSINSYLDKGCPPEKLIAGFPYYGIDWPVSGSTRMASTTAKGSSRFYNVVKNNYLDTMQVSNVFFDATYSTPWYRYYNGSTWRQTWHDDSLSLAIKYDSVKAINIAGVGIWALGYDVPEPELWNLLRYKFTDITSVQSNNTIPSVFSLEQNYPNPFNPSTIIEFTLRETGHTTLKIYDAIGREVAVLANEVLGAGIYHHRIFDARRLASGIYFARLQTGSNTQIRKLMLIK